MALSVFLSVLSILTWGSFFWPKTYEAASTVFIERSSIIDPLIKGVGVYASIEERLRTLKNSVTSRNIIERVTKKLDMDVKSKDPEKYEGLIENIRKNLDISIKGERGGEADLFIISYRDSDPKTARDLVNTLVSEYIEENVGYRRSDTYSAYEFIQGQLSEYKTKLEESDRLIREFREKNPQMVPQSENAVLNRIETFQSGRIESEIKLKELMRKRESLQKQLSGEKELTVAFVTREGSPQSRLDYLNNQLAVLMGKYTPMHPEVLKVKGEIEELQRQIDQGKTAPTEGSHSETASMNPIYQQLKEDLVKTDTEIESLRARSSELQRQQQQAQSIIGQMPKEQEQWAKLQRDRNVYQKIYDDLLEKLENARVSKDLELTNKNPTFRVVDAAILPLHPIKPDKVKMTLLGIFLGIVAGVGAVVGLDYFKNSFKEEDSVEERLKIPVFASIPQIITKEDMAATKKLDRKVFTAAGAYLVIIGLVLVHEALYQYMGINLLKF